MPIDPSYGHDLTRANEYTTDCAFHAGTRAVIAILIDGVRTDVCARCWRAWRAPITRDTALITRACVKGALDPAEAIELFKRTQE
jgi:hypothetical protein